MRLLLRGGLAAALLLLVTAPASALIIDSFDDAASVSADSGTPNDATVTGAGSFLGTNRDLESAWSSGANSIDGEVDAGGSSLLNISMGADTQGSVTVRWNNISNIDLTLGGTLNAIGIEIVFDDLPLAITISVTDGSFNTGSATLFTTGGIFVPIVEALLFSSFSGSVDFGDTIDIELVALSLFPATDVQLGFIESFDSPLPEPSIALLLGIGLVGLATTRARRRTA